MKSNLYKLLILFSFFHISKYNVLISNEDIVDQFYNKIVEFKKTGINNQLKLIRIVKYKYDGKDSTITDTSFYNLNKYYNEYNSTELINLSSLYFFYTIDKVKREINLNFFMKNIKYPLLYSIIDLNGIKYKEKVDNYLIFTKDISFTNIPLKRDYLLYYFNSETSLLDKVEFHYNSNSDILISNLIVQYNSSIDDNLDLNSKIFSSDEILKPEFSNFQIIDNRKR